MLAGGYPGPNVRGGASSVLTASPIGQAMPAIAPAAPPNVPVGSAYSLSRGMWKDPDGNIFDQQGKRVP
jgi:hypothetical protein